MAELTVGVAKDIASGQGATSWEVYQLARWFLTQHGIEAPPYVVPTAALSHAAGQEVERSRLLCWAFDNLNDMPISDEWASEWCRQAESHVLAGHPAVARSEGEAS